LCTEWGFVSACTSATFQDRLILFSQAFRVWFLFMDAFGTNIFVVTGIFPSPGVHIGFANLMRIRKEMRAIAESSGKSDGVCLRFGNVKQKARTSCKRSF
jgi:hypothetical protein